MMDEDDSSCAEENEILCGDGGEESVQFKVA